MACFKWLVYEYDANSELHDTGKSFFISLKESNELRRKAGYGDIIADIYLPALQIVFFREVFGFNVASGYWQLQIDSNTIDIQWRVKTWRLIKASSVKR